MLELVNRYTSTSNQSLIAIAQKPTSPYGRFIDSLLSYLSLFPKYP
ncbi:MAG: hypothetical protein HC903_03365 [Methylacidiphilales bacterium]|nr:hypothetical protein [Candidatus Methylacidiphilales bacterium]NJR18108.1 hypothetical protein [Calothrix sp. CSU_2_0]